jgi:opacity protein-like surface antigen
VTSTIVLLQLASSLAYAQTQQSGRPVEPRGAVGVSVTPALPVGEFADFINMGWGVNATGHFNLTRVLRIRAEGGYIQYGRESHEICLPDCRVRFDEVTTNGIAFGSVGPELMLRTRFVRPYVNAGIGGSYFRTSSHLDGVDDENDIGDTTNFDDGAFLVALGGGVYVPLAVRRAEVALDFGLRYHRNGTVRYLREGGIQNLPDGSISFSLTQSRADLLSFVVGVSVGLGRRSTDNL